MKAMTLCVAALFVSMAGLAQTGKYGATPEDSVACVNNLSLYIEFVKQKSYDDALPGWRKVCEICPKASKKAYLNGVKIYRYKIAEAKKKKDSVQIEAYIDTLMSVYDNRVQHFGQKGYVLGRKATDHLRYRPYDLATANKMYKASMDLRGEKTEAGVISGYYQTLYKLYKKKEIEKAILLEEYLTVSDLIHAAIKYAEKAKNPQKGQKAIERYNKAKNNLDEMFVQIGVCEDIVRIFTQKVEKNPDDFELKKKVLNIMNRRECNENVLYTQIAKAVHEQEPSAASAFSIGKTDFAKGKYSSALTYFKQAIELGPESPDLESYYLGAAQTSLKSDAGPAAFKYAKKALGVNPNSGKAFLIMAQAIAGSKCGGNEFEIKTVYWLAYDKAEKAKSVDPSIAGAASRLMGSYKKSWPSKEMLFNYGMLDKDIYTVKCWVNETTKIREP